MAGRLGTSYLSPIDLSVPAPVWAKQLAEQAIRERDVVPVETWCDTPRGSDGGDEDLLYWMRAAERLVEAGGKGRVSKKEWNRWGEYFDTLPGVGEYFRHLLAELPERTVPRRHGAKKAKGNRVELATSCQEGVPWYPGREWMLPCAVWGWQDYHSYFHAPWPVCQGLR